jgi:hypothetical protein
MNNQKDLSSKIKTFFSEIETIESMEKVNKNL